LIKPTGKCVRAEIAHTVAEESEVEDELQKVFRALSY
jgi:hypothetical protein